MVVQTWGAGGRHQIIIQMVAQPWGTGGRYQMVAERRNRCQYFDSYP